LKSIAERLRPFGDVKDHGELIRANVEGFELVIFRGGRTIVHGTDDEKVARSLVSKYMGD
jgi:adenylyltransferase/sulfurtransferase